MCDFYLFIGFVGHLFPLTAVYDEYSTVHSIFKQAASLDFMVTVAEPISQMNNKKKTPHILNDMKGPSNYLCYCYLLPVSSITKQLKISEINWLGQIAPCCNSIGYTRDEFSTIFFSIIKATFSHYPVDKLFRRSPSIRPIREKENPFPISHCLIFIFGTNLRKYVALKSD